MKSIDQRTMVGLAVLVLSLLLCLCLGTWFSGSTTFAKGDASIQLPLPATHRSVVSAERVLGPLAEIETGEKFNPFNLQAVLVAQGTKGALEAPPPPPIVSPLPPPLPLPPVQSEAP